MFRVNDDDNNTYDNNITMNDNNNNNNNNRSITTTGKQSLLKFHLGEYPIWKEFLPRAIMAGQLLWMKTSTTSTQSLPADTQ